MYFTNEANDLMNMIINNDLESVFEIRESELVYTSGYKYGFFCNDKIINVFEITTDTKELDKLAMFEYILGFIDSYIICNRITKNSLTNRVS